MAGEVAPAGWYLDPTGHGEGRYWNGTSWTESVDRGGVTVNVPIDPAQAHVPPIARTEVSVGAPTSAPPAAAPRRSPVGAIIGGIVLILVIVGVVLLVSNNSDSSDDSPPSTDAPPATEAPAAPGTDGG